MRKHLPTSYILPSQWFPIYFPRRSWTRLRLHGEKAYCLFSLCGGPSLGFFWAHSFPLSSTKLHMLAFVLHSCTSFSTYMRLVLLVWDRLDAAGCQESSASQNKPQISHFIPGGESFKGWSLLQLPAITIEAFLYFGLSMSQKVREADSIEANATGSRTGYYDADRQDADEDWFC